MPACPILQLENPLLRDISLPVTSKEFGSPKIKKIIEDMKDSLALCEDGVALAAPQIGISKRIFVVSPKAYEGASVSPGDSLVYINPRIEKNSRKKIALDEGCLSVRGCFGQTLRAAQTTIVAQDESGKLFKRGASGLLSQIFQHETDHLDGILFVDTAKNIKNIEPDQLQN